MNTRNILLGVSGGIAAYKAPDLVRRLSEQGADVQVVLTKSASRFVSATALQAVSGRPVRDSLWDRAAEAAMSHIELARWADRIVIAPATAEVLSRLAGGSAADLLSTLCLASSAPLFIAPAMNHVMWAHPAVQANCETLKARGVTLLGPDSGDQACGEQGLGRMSEPEAIAAAVLGDAPAAHAPRPGVPQRLAGTTVMVTAGPTREAIDPVRYISNRSSGKMGYALAQAALDAGARVILLSGPVDIDPPAGAEFVPVETAQQLFAAAHEHIDDVDIFVGAAAVADYRPEKVAPQKIKKLQAEMSIALVRAPDTLTSVARLEQAPFTVGFAAETEQLQDHARGKLRDKKLDMIIGNTVGADQGFDRDDNAVEVYWADGSQAFPTAPKSELAGELMALIAERYAQRYSVDTQTELPPLTAHD